MAQFPSDEHYAELRKKGFDGRRTDEDQWAWHAYSYGWRRIMLQTRDDLLPIDPARVWFNPTFAALAEIYWSRKLRIRAPDIAAAQRIDNSPDEIATMLARSEAARRYIDGVTSRMAKFQPYRDQARGAADRDAIRRAHEAMGVSAQERGASNG